MTPRKLAKWLQTSRTTSPLDFLGEEVSVCDLLTFSSGLKRPGREADHSPLSIVEITNTWTKQRFSAMPPKT